MKAYKVLLNVNGYLFSPYVLSNVRKNCWNEAKFIERDKKITSKLLKEAGFTSRLHAEEKAYGLHGLVNYEDAEREFSHNIREENDKPFIIQIWIAEFTGNVERKQHKIFGDIIVSKKMKLLKLIKQERTEAYRSQKK